MLNLIIETSIPNAKLLIHDNTIQKIRESFELNEINVSFQEIQSTVIYANINGEESELILELEKLRRKKMINSLEENLKTEQVKNVWIDIKRNKKNE